MVAAAFLTASAIAHGLDIVDAAGSFETVTVDGFDPEDLFGGDGDPGSGFPLDEGFPPGDLPTVPRLVTEGPSTRDALAAAATGVANPLVPALLLAAVFLAVLDDVLTGVVATARRLVAAAVLWMAMVVGALVVVAAAYAAYEALVASPPRFGPAVDGTPTVLGLAATIGLGGAAAWLAFRALGDTAVEPDPLADPPPGGAGAST